KKVGIAVALIKKPKLYIMDEPTNGLDPLVKKSLFSLLKAEVENGSTVFISSHNLKEIEDHCNRVAFIKSGKIIDEVEIDDNMNRSKVVKIVGEFDDGINSLEGLRDLKVNESYYRFLFNGEMSTLLSKLNNMEISDISINNISLEEEFLGYYESGENHDN
ncbi:MAG: AAA family ATPase, partial [Tissierellia bacterium]|nr:AAA family ATPase [Tissierellia bacterium]